MKYPNVVERSVWAALQINRAVVVAILAPSRDRLRNRAVEVYMRNVRSRVAPSAARGGTKRVVIAKRYVAVALRVPAGSVNPRNCPDWTSPPIVWVPEVIKGVSATRTYQVDRFCARSDLRTREAQRPVPRRQKHRVSRARCVQCRQHAGIEPRIAA